MFCVSIYMVRCTATSAKWVEKHIPCKFIGAYSTCLFVFTLQYIPNNMEIRFSIHEYTWCNLRQNIYVHMHTKHKHTNV